MFTATKSIFNCYKKSLYFILPFTTSMGFSSGLVDVFGQPGKAESLQVFTTVVGYTALGVATGITYPMTFPTIMYSVLSTPNLSN
jgi:hypothetical protein